MAEGLLSTRKFTRFLNELGPLMFALKTFEVVYTAASSANFLESKAAFRKAFEIPLLRDSRHSKVLLHLPRSIVP